MHLSAICTVYLSELRRLLRDHHVLVYSVAVPAFLYPLLLIGAVEVIVYVQGLEGRRTSRIELKAAALDASLRTVLEETLTAEGSRVELARHGTTESADSAPVDATLAVEAPSPVSSAEETLLRPLAAEVVFHGARDRSVQARQRLESRLEAFSRRRLADACRARGADESLLDAVDVDERSLSTPAELANHLAGLVLPLVLVIMAALGAFYPALETSVAEKERGTLETTLLAPVPRSSLVAGKYLAVTSFSLLSFALNFTSLALTLGSLSTKVPLAPLSLGWTALAVVALAAFLLAAFFSAAMTLLAFLARSFKEGQSYVAPLYLLALVPVAVTADPELRLTPPLALVPLVNCALLFRDAIEGRLDLLAAALALASSALLALAALAGAARVLSRESVLTGGDARLADLLRSIFRSRERNNAGGPA
jgi:sodium transport system permease protein